MTHAMARMDPRLKERRIAVQRAEGRRRLRTLLAVLGIAGVAGLAWLVSRSPLLDVDEVTVDGIDGAAAAEVLLIADVTSGTPLIDIDVAEVATAVAGLPWVRTAIVERQWPNQVRVEVIERIPIARMPTSDGRHALIDSYGVVVRHEAAGADVSALPILAVVSAREPGAVETTVLSALPLAESIPADLAPWVSSLGVVHEGAAGAHLTLDLVGGAVAELGGADDLADKLDALRAVLAGTDLTCLALVDVRVPDLPTVTRDPVCDSENADDVAALEGA